MILRTDPLRSLCLVAPSLWRPCAPTPHRDPPSCYFRQNSGKKSTTTE
jgi:hypothetical protein